MPRYHFDVMDGGNVLRDENGEICADPAAAEAEGIKVAAEMAKHELGRQRDFERTVEVREESDEPFLRVRAVMKLEVQRLR
jgi:hypothetical protein